MELDEAPGHETLCEYFFADLAASPCGEAAIPRDGYLAVPNGPGLGVEVDGTFVERFGAAIPNNEQLLVERIVERFKQVKLITDETAEKARLALVNDRQLKAILKSINSSVVG